MGTLIMSKRIGGDHGDPPSAPRERGSAQNPPGVEVVGVTLGTSVAVITVRFVYEIKGGTQGVYAACLSGTRDSFCVVRVLSRYLLRAG